MKPVSTFVVSPTIPPALAPLRELAYNYWWCWNGPAIDLFRRLDPVLWDEVHHNPVAHLAQLSHEKLASFAERADYVKQMQDVYTAFRSYMDDRGWYSTLEHRPASYIAYFCAEFGIHESFRNYSGGLGVLAGDHLKSASDLGLPLVGVGLLYQEGYFRQYLTQNGWQNEHYLEVDFHALPLTPVQKADGTSVTITVDLPLGKCHARIWRLNVGRIPLYLLDTNIPENTNPILRDVTHRLYGGEQEMRLMQEKVLGIGGVRALQAIGIEPATIHCNEGHAAFSLLERTKKFMERFGMDFSEAWRITQGSSVFTTHTPVPAGNEVFSHDLLRPFFEDEATGLGLTWEQFIALGAKNGVSGADGFSMTVLGLRGSSYRNGVSILHGAVAREMWQEVWSNFSLNEVPINGLTNGIHTSTWVAPEMVDLYDRYLGPAWRSAPHEASSWENVDSIPDLELWRAHVRRRERLVVGARAHVLKKHSASLTAEQANHIHDCLDPDVLTIGFARRFATYKRADLLMYDMERLARIVNHETRPIQIILAGKAHPKDGLGKELIQSVHQKIKEMGLDHRIVFLEDYDMDVARLMVRGCDVWLNTPRRPYEASGTSGMKGALNGVLHCSILDGWWAEAYDGENGFAIGRGEELEPAEQDQADAMTLYDILEHAIVPRFYDVSAGRVPERWTAMMKQCIKSLAPQFSALRMVSDYTNNAYRPAMERYRQMTDQNGQAARDAERFFAKINSSWQNVHVGHVVVHGTEGANVGKHIHISAEIQLGDLLPDQVIVQAVYGRVDSHDEITPASTVDMRFVGIESGSSLYEGEYKCTESGIQGCTVRVMPTHPSVPNVPDVFRVAYANGHGSDQS